MAKLPTEKRLFSTRQNLQETLQHILLLFHLSCSWIEGKISG
jgi:hypothetical protein